MIECKLNIYIAISTIPNVALYTYSFEWVNRVVCIYLLYLLYTYVHPATSYYITFWLMTKIVDIYLSQTMSVSNSFKSHFDVDWMRFYQIETIYQLSERISIDFYTLVGLQHSHTAWLHRLLYFSPFTAN